MRKRLTTALAVFAAATVLFPCCNKKNGDDIIREITLNKTKITLTEGETFLLTAKLSPENGTENGIVWSSEDSGVATVSDEGEVTGVKAGETVITAAALSDGNVKATCLVTVQAPVAVTGVKINYDGEELNLFSGTSFSLSATVEPADAADRQLTWTIDKTEFATVDADGKVSADKQAEGTATLTVSAGGKSASLKVHSYKAGLSVSSMSILAGGELSFKNYFLTGSIPVSDYTFSSDNPEVATIDGDLKIVGKSYGTAVISARYSGTAIAKFETEPSVRFEVTVADSFVASVTDVLTVTGRGVVLTTSIESGTVKVGDKLRILQPDDAKGHYIVTVKGISMFNKAVDSATVGDAPGILIGDQLTKDKLMTGAVLMSENANHIAGAQRIVGTVTVIKSTPVQLNEQDQFYSSYGADVTGTFTKFNGRETLPSGGTYDVIWATIADGYRFICRIGQKIIVRNSGKEVATMVIDGTLPFPGKEVEYTDVSQPAE